jgi:hypothetical protein
MNKTKLTQEEKDKRKLARKITKQTEQEAQKVETEKNQKPVKSIKINIEWAKSRTWGSNPRAEIWVSYQDGLSSHAGGFTCSGCGYDKESTVIAEIFNQYLKYTLWDKTFEECKGGQGSGDVGSAPYGIRVNIYEDNETGVKREYRGFSGGIGTSCYRAIAEFIGGKFENISSGKYFDCFMFTINN